MSEEFIGLVIFDGMPVADAAGTQAALQALEPRLPVEVSPAGNGLRARLGSLAVQLDFVNAPLHEQEAISSLGMSNLPEDVRHRLLEHKCHVRLTCESGCDAAPAEGMVALLKLGMVLCAQGGLALCVPTCGNCHPADVLAAYAAENQQGPRAWGVEDAESELVTYERYTLWDSLRAQAEPAELMVGFVPAQLGEGTWFFSAGHSLYGMPELAWADGSIEDFSAVKEFFRVLFRTYFKRPQDMTFGQSLQLSGSVTLNLERLPEKYRQFEASTGTLMVRVTESLFPDKDWD